MSLRPVWGIRMTDQQNTIFLARKYFKTDECFNRFEYLHPTVRNAAADAITWALEAGVDEPCITETATTGKHDKALGRVSQSHETRRAFDFRTWNMTPVQRLTVTDKLSAKYGKLGAISKDGNNRSLVVYHDSGHGAHLHVQLDSSFALAPLDPTKGEM
jgi:hypothetical protein